MTLPIADIKAALQAWLNPLGKPVVWQFQNTPDPKRAPLFISINPAASYQRIGSTDDQVFDSESETLAIVQHRNMLCSVHAVGIGALELLTRAVDRLALPGVYANFTDHNLAAVAGTVRDLSAEKNGVSQQRAQVDLTIRCTAGETNEEGGGVTPIAEPLGAATALRYSAPIVGVEDYLIEGD